MSRTLEGMSDCEDRMLEGNYGLYRVPEIAPSTSGAYTGCRRVAALGGLRAAVATGRDVWLCEVARSSLAPYTAAELAEQRRTGLVRPLRAAAAVSALQQHAAEVVDIAVAPHTAAAPQERVLATTDVWGTTVLTRCRADGGASPAPAAAAATLPAAQGRERACAEAGPGTAAFSADGAVLVRTQQLQHSIEVLDVERGTCVRRLRTLNGPARAAFLPTGMLAVAEGASLALYDVRADSSSNTAALRLDAAAGTAELHCVEWAPRMGWLLVAGDDRCISAVDVTAGGVAARWPACTQLSVCLFFTLPPFIQLPTLTVSVLFPHTHLSQTCGVFPSTASECVHRCYAIGSNSQVVSGCISKKRERPPAAGASSASTRPHSLRVDSRWIGAALAETGDSTDGDVLLGVTAAASLYVLRNTEQLLAATVTQDDDDAGAL